MKAQVFCEKLDFIISEHDYQKNDPLCLVPTELRLVLTMFSPTDRDWRGVMSDEWWVMSEEWGVRSEELHRESPDDWRAASCAWCGDGLSFTLPLSLSSSCGAWQCKSGRWRTDLAKHRDVTIKTDITDNWVTIEDRVHPYILIHHYNFMMKGCKTSISLIIDWNLNIK